MDSHTVLYQLIIRQLQDDGFHQAAHAVSSSAMVIPPSKEMFERNHLANMLMPSAKNKKGAGASSVGALLSAQEDVSLDLDEEYEGPPLTSTYSTAFITTHKNECRVARFSQDGQLVATASGDSSIKLIDVARTKLYASAVEGHGHGHGSNLPRPVVRTYYDHTDAVNDVAFHPTAEVLVSCARDASIKCYDYSDSSKRAFRFIPDSHSMRSLDFHPSGDFIVAGTDHSMIRLFDVATFTAYVSPHVSDHHYASVNSVRYARDGSHFASGSMDGTIRIYDPVTHRCVQYIPNAHVGSEVFSVEYSTNANYIVSAGEDGCARVFDLRMGTQVKCFGRAEQNSVRFVSLPPLFLSLLPCSVLLAPCLLSCVLSLFRLV
eukprot:TRINITY_DN6943_c0_g1_i3.p1 TRINITY_DN6943_c0_g1~~TRINITY_DN6943_c0_g1_i3.p1  ORF type:complete len:376 (+),score=132.73 TRINITY_DN6943_c0_g1_i3:220-1347(+)